MSADRTNKHTATDVVVSGAGVIGLAIAWRAAQAGLGVVVADRAEPGSGASHAAAGMLAPVTEADFGEQDLTALNLAAAERFPSFAAELEDETALGTGYRPSGTLSVAVDRDQAEALERMQRFRASLGLAAERLSARECRRLEPGLAPRVLGGVLAAGDHQVDPRALVTALLEALRRARIEVSRGAAVEAILTQGDTVAGVRLAGGREIHARHVVIAAGAGAGSIGGIPGDARVPIRPVKGQILRLCGTATAPQPLQRVLRTEDFYAVPRADGTLVIGATMEERGFDLTVTAGAVLDLLRYAYDVVPGVAELELVETGAGLRPTAPDNAPVVGAGALDGLVWATGHWRNGVLLAPVTADAVTDLLTGRAAHPLFARFGADRFSARGRLAGAPA
jgi:glycine oxidase